MPEKNKASPPAFIRDTYHENFTFMGSIVLQGQTVCLLRHRQTAALYAVTSHKEFEALLRQHTKRIDALLFVGHEAHP